MKYYSFKPCGVETTKFCEPRLFGEWAGEPLFSNDWENRNLTLPITMTVKNKYNPGDHPLADSALVSQKLLDVIKQVNKDYEALPTQLYYKEKEPIWDIYYSMIFPEYEAFNFEKSKYSLFGKYIVLIDDIVLDADKIHIHGERNGIFALKEKSTIIICTETAKNTIESAGIKDVRFTELPVE